MGSWELFWAVVFAGTMTVFFALSVVVAVGGFRDVKAMFRNLRARHDGD
jgi:hypothetical protein